MGKLGDLWVRLGLKKDEFSKGLKDARQETSSFADSMKNIGMLGKAAFAGIAAGVVAVVGAIKELSNQNQTLGDAVGKLSAGFDAMFDTLKTSLASLDFTDLITNLLEANHLARELYDAYDAMGEISTSYELSLSRQLNEINELKLALRDQNLSNDERIKAGEKLLEIYRKLEENPTRGLERVKDTTLDYYMQRMGVETNNRTDKELAVMRKKYADFFVWLGTKQGETYSAAAQEVSKLFGGLDSDKGRAYMRNAANNGMAEYARLAYEYNRKIGNKDLDKIKQAVAGYYQQENKYSAETLRIQTQINSIKAQQAETGKKNLEVADKEREQAEKTLQRAKDAAKSEVQLLSEKYDEEKALLEKYGLDTTALWEEYVKNMKKVFDTNLKDLKIEIDFDALNDIDLSEFDEEIQRTIEDITNKMDTVEDFLRTLRDSVVGGFEDAIQQLTDQFMGLEDINPGRVTQALLTPLADMAIKAGEVIIAEGVAVEAAKDALTTFQGIGAIAAGGLLIAAGAAAKSGLSALAQSGGRNTSASTYSGGSGASGTQNYESELTVYVKGTIRGSDIVLSGQKTVNNWNR